MSDTISIIFSLIAIALYSASLSLLILIIKKTKGKFNLSVILWSVSVGVLILAEFFDLINLGGEIFHGLIIALAAILLGASVYNIFDQVRDLTDVKITARYPKNL